MRAAAITLVVASAVIRAALAEPFPPPLAKRAVSDAIFTGAPSDQLSPKVATNGDMSLAAWYDARGQTVFASRVDAAGKVLDPLGVKICGHCWFLNEVLWNGESFEIVISAETLALVTPDMRVTIRQANVEWQYSYGAATTAGDVRLLYLDGNRAAIVDRNGILQSRKTIPGLSDRRAIAGTDGGFLLLRSVRDAPNAIPYLVSDRLDRDGNVISSKLTQLSLPDGSLAIAGGAGGFLVTRVESGVLSTYQLDADGVYTGKAYWLAIHAANVAVVRDDDRYLVSYQHDGIDSISEIDMAGSVTVHDYGTPAGHRSGIAVASFRGNRVLATSVDRKAGSGHDVFIRQLTPALEAADASLVTSGATRQASPGVAAAVNGFAVSWSEGGPGLQTHVFVRRFSKTGVPQDESPILVDAYPSDNWYGTLVSITANDETYVIAWLKGSEWFIRRLTARSGALLDSSPVPLSLTGSVVLASNGSDAIALGGGDSYHGELPRVRVIHLTGAPLTSPAMSVAPAGYPFSLIDLAVASSGSDYLAVWVAGSATVDLCSCPTKIYAMRLRADATAIDAKPLSLDASGRDQQRIGIAWADGRWLVTWRCYACGSGSSLPVRGMRISADGAVLDHDAEDGGVGLLNVDTTVTTSFENRFALLFRTSPSWLAGVTFGADVDLAGFAKLRGTLLAVDGDVLYEEPAAAAANGPFLGTVYRRVGADAGWVEREVLQISMHAPSRRRPAAH